MREVPRKRRLGDGTFWTDTLSMNLRETFDEGFLAAVRAHQGLPTLPSPKPPPTYKLILVASRLEAAQ